MEETEREIEKAIPVSVIAPVYNDASGIRNLLDALLAQTYPEHAFEIIVVDNGSTDRTVEVIREFEVRHLARIRLGVEDSIQGPGAARNKGIQMAEGEILAFTDADCRPAPTWLERGVESLTQEDAMSVGGRVELTFREKNPNIYEYLNASVDFDQRSYVEEDGWAATANLFVRRDVFDRYGLFRTELRYWEDYEFCRRFTGDGGKLAYSEEAVVFHPARASLGALLDKTKGVAKARRQLETVGLIEKDPLTWRSFVPWTRYTPLNSAKLTLSQRAQVMLVAICCKYYQLLYQLVFLRVDKPGPGGGEQA